MSRLVPKCMFNVDELTRQIYLHPKDFWDIEKWEFVVINGEKTNYMISNLGRVENINTGYVLAPIMNRDGYLFVRLSNKGKQKNYLIHRLVAIAFLPNPDNLPQINHINEVKTDNRLINIEWCSAEYNVNYGTRTERTLETKRKKRESFAKNT